MSEVAMPDESVAERRYGPVSFVVALVHILFVDVFTWVFIPIYLAAVLAIPVMLVYMGIGALIARSPGNVGQTGRGMLIGTFSGPLTMIVFIPLWFLAHAAGFLR